MFSKPLFIVSLGIAALALIGSTERSTMIASPRQPQALSTALVDIWPR
ncbi:hypothetical protein [Pseudomonas sp. UBA7530]|nr:hypothetical protein [Pseudomonas sp. UBA7530]